MLVLDRWKRPAECRQHAVYLCVYVNWYGAVEPCYLKQPLSLAMYIVLTLLIFYNWALWFFFVASCLMYIFLTVTPDFRITSLESLNNHLQKLRVTRNLLIKVPIDGHIYSIGLNIALGGKSIFEELLTSINFNIKTRYNTVSDYTTDICPNIEELWI